MLTEHAVADPWPVPAGQRSTEPPTRSDVRSCQAREVGSRASHDAFEGASLRLSRRHATHVVGEDRELTGSSHRREEALNTQRGAGTRASSWLRSAYTRRSATSYRSNC
jgi:hypothetical protein